MFLDALCSSRSAIYGREKGYSMAVEVTRHLPGPFQSEGLNFSSWRAPQEPTDWLLLASDLGATHPDLCWQGGPHCQPLHQRTILQHLQQHLHTLPRKCVKWQIPTTKMTYYNSWMWWKTLATRARVPIFFLPSGSRFLCENSINYWQLLFLYQKDISNPSTNFKTHTIIMTKNFYLSDLFKDSSIC